jgi:hypothetical protein
MFTEFLQREQTCTLHYIWYTLYNNIAAAIKKSMMVRMYINGTLYVHSSTVKPTVWYPPYAALQRADLTRRGVCDYGQLLKLQMNPAVV